MTVNHLYRQSFQHALQNNDFFIWFIAIALSLSAHFVFFLQRQTLIAAPSTLIQETITHVRFAAIAPPPVNVSKPEVTTPRPEPVVPPEPDIIQKQKPEPIIKPEVTPKSTPKPKPVPKPEKQKKPITKPKPQVIKKPVKPKPLIKERLPELKQRTITQTPSPKKITTVKASPLVAEADARLVEQTRMSYHAQLMRHIDVHKNYPRVARRRNIQGNILVTFTLLADGNIKNLSLSGKKSILKKATLQAVNNALPMPTPPKGLSFPMEIKFTMNYSLK